MGVDQNVYNFGFSAVLVVMGLTWFSKVMFPRMMTQHDEDRKAWQQALDKLTDARDRDREIWQANLLKLEETHGRERDAWQAEMRELRSTFDAAVQTFRDHVDALMSRPCVYLESERAKTAAHLKVAAG
jgi:hypothetical protein